MVQDQVKIYTIINPSYLRSECLAFTVSLDMEHINCPKLTRARSTDFSSLLWWESLSLIKLSNATILSCVGY